MIDKCPRCGAPTKVGAKFCTSCGASISAQSASLDHEQGTTAQQWRMTEALEALIKTCELEGEPTRDLATNKSSFRFSDLVAGHVVHFFWECWESEQRIVLFCYPEEWSVPMRCKSQAQSLTQNFNDNFYVGHFQTVKDVDEDKLALRYVNGMDGDNIEVGANHLLNMLRAAIATIDLFVQNHLDSFKEIGQEPADTLSGDEDPLYSQAVEVVLRNRKGSLSLVQRQLNIEYNRAARIMEAMEHAGLVSPMNASGQREVLVPMQK